MDENEFTIVGKLDINEYNFEDLKYNDTENLLTNIRDIISFLKIKIKSKSDFLEYIIKEKLNGMIPLINDIYPLGQRDSYGRSCVHYSAVYKNLQVLPLLLDNGLNINDKDLSNRKIDHFIAVSKGYLSLDIVKGLDFEFMEEDIYGFTSCHYSVINDNILLFADLLKLNKAKCIYKKSKKAIIYPQIPSCKDYTPNNYRICNDFFPAINLNSLSVIALFGKDEFIKYLHINHKVDFDIYSGIACLLDIPLEWKIDLSAENRYHLVPPVCFSKLEGVTKDVLRTLKTLVECGLNIHSTTENGLTLGHCASALGLNDVLIFLKEKGLKFSVRDNKNRTMAHHAAKFGNAETLIYLRNNFSPMLTRDSYGKFPWNYAGKSIGVYKLFSKYML